MAWYRNGTISVTNGSAAVTGSGTLWVDAGVLNPGDITAGPDGKLYEILSIQSNTALTLASNYLGATASGQSYSILPIGLLPSALAQQVKTTLASANTALQSAILSTAGQSLTSQQQANARANIAALGAGDIGKGYMSKSVAGGVDVTLSAAEDAAEQLELTGTLTANINVIVSATARQRSVKNSTSGAYTVTVKASAGGVVVPQGYRMALACDGITVFDSLDDYVRTAASQMLSNKSLISPIISGGATVTGDVLSSGIVKAAAFIVSDANVTINDIGIPGAAGFGVGICPGPLPAGMGPLSNGTYLPWDADYGNYRYSDGSIMCWVPAYYYKWGTGANGLAINAVSIAALSAYANEAAANAAGFALHRAFKDGGANKAGVFVDKFIVSNNGGTASSIKNGNPLSAAAAHNPFSGLTGAPANYYYGAITAAKTRGASFFCSSRFITAALAMLSYAHAQASSSTTYCAWYHATNNFPKGCNNNALRDTNDTSIIYVSDGYSNCGKTGSANYFARTTHNGQACGVADLNGLMWEVTPCITSNGTNFYILKTSAAMKDVTGGNTLATDLWGATGIAALYDDLGTAYGAAWEAGANRTTYYGSASQVFSEATSGNAWNWAGMGGMLAAGDGGTNAFGSDSFWDYKLNEMCPISGGDWTHASSAGVWALHLASARGAANGNVGFRAALYL